MNDLSRLPVDASSIAAAYEADGYYFPHDVISEREAGELLADLEAAEAELAGDRSRLSLLRSYTARLLPSFDRLIRNSRLVDVAAEIIGPDLLVWGSSLFIKEANSPSYVSWHQDLNYWGLNDELEVTAWISLTPSTVENGCMRFVPGSHKRKTVPHVDSFAKNNMLTRGQELAVDVDEAEAVNVLLKAGQGSFHHGHMFHASGPNQTSERRVGAAIRYISTSMKQTTGEKLILSQVSGTDTYGHYTVAPPPAGRLLDEDFDRIRFNMEAKRNILYQGVKPELVKATPRV